MRGIPAAVLCALLVAAGAPAGEVIIGEMGFPLNMPFCGT